MILYIARHGQPALDDMKPGADYELPDGDYPLSALGREQAEFLGKYLKQENFDGLMISSPYARTMETAAVAASICGTSIVPEPRFQERLFAAEPPCSGMTIEELRRFYPVSPDAELEYPWIITKGPEEAADVEKRVFPLVDELISAPPAEKILLIGHGASVNTAMRYLAEKANYSGNRGIAFNAAVSCFGIEHDGSVKLIHPMKFDYMPMEKVTSNKRTYEEVINQ